MWPGPAVADLDGDGAREIVVVQANQLSILDAAGDPLPGTPLQPSEQEPARGPVLGLPALAQLGEEIWPGPAARAWPGETV